MAEEAYDNEWRIPWEQISLSCSSEEIRRSIEKAEQSGLTLLQQFGYLKEQHITEKQSKAAGLEEFLDWLLSRQLSGADFSLSLGEAVIQLLSLCGDATYDEQEQQIAQLVECLRDLRTTEREVFDALRLADLIPADLLYERDLEQWDFEVPLQDPKQEDPSHFLYSGLSMRLSHLVLMGNSYKRVFWFAFISAYIKTRYVMKLQAGPGQPWIQLPYHFCWTVDNVRACVSDTGGCRENLWVCYDKKNQCEYHITWKFNKPYCFLFCSTRNRSSFHEVKYGKHTWRWKWCDKQWKNGNAWYWG